MYAGMNFSRRVFVSDGVGYGGMKGVGGGGWGGGYRTSTISPPVCRPVSADNLAGFPRRNQLPIKILAPAAA
jgi:hypothetical protein